MSRIIRLTERDLTRLVRRVIQEEENSDLTVLATKIFNHQVKIANMIIKWFPNSFKQFKGLNDDEDGAVTYMKNTLWPDANNELRVVKSELYDFGSKMGRSEKSMTMWEVLDDNQMILTYKINSKDFYEKMGGETSDDTYVFSLKHPITGSKTTFTIDTDF
jgi:hypothetical protein